MTSVTKCLCDKNGLVKVADVVRKAAPTFNSDTSSLITYTTPAFTRYCTKIYVSNSLVPPVQKSGEMRSMELELLGISHAIPWGVYLSQIAIRASTNTSCGIVP